MPAVHILGNDERTRAWGDALPNGGPDPNPELAEPRGWQRPPYVMAQVGDVDVNLERKTFWE